MFARYGGEEFLIIAPNCGFPEVAQLADRILSRVRGTTIKIDNQVLRVTISAGVSIGRAPSTTEEVIMVADRALYKAKANGRNRVEVEFLPLADSLYLAGEYASAGSPQTENAPKQQTRH